MQYSLELEQGTVDPLYREYSEYRERAGVHVSMRLAVLGIRFTVMRMLLLHSKTRALAPRRRLQVYVAHCAGRDLVPSLTLLSQGSLLRSTHPTTPDCEKL